MRPARRSARSAEGWSWGRWACPLLLPALLFAIAASSGCGSASRDVGSTVSTPAASTTLQPPEAGALMVYAASDMAPVLAELGPKFATQTGVAVTVNLGATGQLVQQVTAGAPADVFLAASVSALDQLDAGGLLEPGSSQTYARGRLALVSRDGLTPSLATLADLRSDDVGRIALANPEQAPYGRAAKEALISAGLWEALQPRLVFAESARQAQQIVGTGNAGAGFVPLSLALAAEESYVLVPQDLYAPLEQGLAVIAGAKHPEAARAFVEYLTGPDGRVLLEKYGFDVPSAP